MKTIMIIVAVFACTSLSFAGIINVPSDIDSIQGGIDMAVDGDSVLVQPGTYVENINFNGKNIVVGSLTLITGDTSFISQTIISADTSIYWANRGRVVTFESGEDSTALLCGFTLTNGYAPYLFYPNGGGILMLNSSPCLSFLMIKNNTAGSSGELGNGSGGGVFCENSNSILTNVIIKNNTSSRGGGLYCMNSDIVLEHVKVIDNRVNLGHSDGLAGGGIFFYSSSPTLANVEIIGNTTAGGAGGGGIYCSDSNPSFSNVTIMANTANTSSGSNLGGGICFVGNSLPIFDPVNRCNIYFNNARIGRDLFADDSLNIAIVVDTFTVMNPTNYFTYPVENFTFDILNAKVEQVNSDLYVNPIGDNSNSGLSPADPLKTINYALMRIRADSLDSHSIYLANGEYSPSTTEESYPLDMRNYVSLSGESETGVILNAENTNAVIDFYTDRAITIENLTITGGEYGIACFYSSPSIKNVTITQNTWYGIICQGSEYPGYDSKPSLSNITITKNNGDGIGCWLSTPSLSNLTITENSGNGINCHLTTICLVNTILWNNLSGSIYLYPSGDEVYAFYSDIQGGWPGEGNKNSDPMFVDTTNGDYRLLEGSPCIDKGIQDTMIVYNDGQDTLFVPAIDYIGSAPDMGAYEFGDPSSIKSETNIKPIVNSLLQNYPNPFNPITNIKFQIPNSKFVTLKIYNILGEEVATLVNNKLEAGNHTYQFDGKNLASGIYYYQIVAGDYREIKKMMLMK